MNNNNLNNRNSQADSMPHNNMLENAQNNTKMRNDADVNNKNINTKPRTQASPKSSNSNTNYQTKNNIRTPNQIINQNKSHSSLNNIGGPAGKKITNGSVINNLKKNKLAQAIPGVGLAQRLSSINNKRKKFLKPFSLNMTKDEEVNEDNKEEIDDNTDNESQNKLPEVISGSVDLFAKIKKYKWFLIGGLSMFGVILILALIGFIIGGSAAGAGGFSSDASSTDFGEQVESQFEKGDEIDLSDEINDTGFIDDNLEIDVQFVKNKLDLNIEDIADYYGVNAACNGKKSKKCTDGNEYRFFLKMYDIYFLYKNQYNVKLDLPLIMATLNYKNTQMPVVFKNNLNDYNREDLNNQDYQGNLSWEFDYKNYEGYKYLNSKDDRFDMQILAKNMVTKKITYKCGSDTKETNDIEKSNYSSKLECSNPTDISETYELDKKKYNEFLLEYIEHKYFIKGEEVENVENNNTEDSTTYEGSSSLADSFVKVAEDEYKKFNNGITSAWTYQSEANIGNNFWCAAFVNYVAKRSTYKGKSVHDIVNPICDGSVSCSMVQFKDKSHLKFYFNDSCSRFKGKNGNITYKPKKGDYIFFDWNNRFSGLNSIYLGTDDVSHIGIVKSVSDNVVMVIEGNCNNKICNDSPYYLTDCDVVGYGSWY